LLRVRCRGRAGAACGIAGRYTEMATMYLMNLEDRVDLARNQLDRVILRLRSVRAQERPEDVEQAVELAATQLQNISELIGR
jgi:hypothetical protein